MIDQKQSMFDGDFAQNPQGQILRKQKTIGELEIEEANPTLQPFIGFYNHINSLIA